MRYRELVEKICDRITDKNPISYIMSIMDFNWVEGLGMYGLLRAEQKYGFGKYIDFINNWVENNEDKAYRINTVNGTAALLATVDMWNDEDISLCKYIGEYIVNDAKRIDNGALEHTVIDPNYVFHQQMWADTLFMSCIYLCKLSRNLGEKKYADEAIKQLRLHHEFLKDKNTGLFYHGYSCETKDNLSAILWARANAWITASTVEILELLPDDFEGRDEILESLNEQIAGYAKYQKENGMLTTIINDPASYEETSATAGMAYGICRGIKNGYISSDYEYMYKKAVESVVSKIDSEGYVRGVSSGTPICPNAQGYKDIIIEPTLYGQALTILLLCEVDS